MQNGADSHDCSHCHVQRLHVHHAADSARRGHVPRRMNCDLCSLKEVQLEDGVALLLLLLLASGLLVLAGGFRAAPRWKHSARALRPVAGRRTVLYCMTRSVWHVTEF